MREGRRFTARIVIDARVTQGGFPGIGRATSSLLRELLVRDLNHELLLLVQSDRSVDEELRLSMRLPHRFLRTGSSLRSIGDQWELPLRLHRARADLFHATYFATSALLPVTTVVNCFDLIPIRFPEYWPATTGRVIRNWLRWSVTRSSRIVAPSEATKGDLQALFNMRAEKITVIPLAPEEALRRQVRSGGSIEPPFMLCVCTNKPHKNLERLVQGYAIASTQYHLMPSLVLAGGWDTRYPGAQRAAEQLGLLGSTNARTYNSVCFVHSPSDEQLTDLYSSATFFVFPSLYEGFGLPVLEAMQCALPVAVSRTPAVAEVVGNAALLFDAQSPDAIADALLRLTHDPALREELSARSLQRVRLYSWADAADKVLAVYNELV